MDKLAARSRLSKSKEAKKNDEDKNDLPGLTTFLKVLYGLRIALCLVPQHGYIQPDEFFQFTEPVADDVLGVKTYLPWEFTQSAPLRSMFFPGLISGSSFLLVKWIENFMRSSYPYLLLVTPRLIMALMSLICDASISSIMTTMKCTNEARKLSMVTFASSYVALTYLTHTFTNSIEAVLFSLLLLTVTRMANDRSSSNFDLQAWIGYVLSYGFFNRPTFVVFAAIPMLWLKFNIIKTFGVVASLRKMMTVGFSFLVASTFLTMVDTWYYNGEAFRDVSQAADVRGFDLLVQKVVLTPINFLLYNSKTGNLQNHGLHPFYFHALVSIPLISSSLAFYFYADVIKTTFDLVRLRICSPSTRHFLLASIAVPLVSLSAVPHQEPRFLLPCLIPLAILYGSNVAKKKSLFGLWLFTNAILLFVYGFAHQAGVTRSLLQLHREIREPSATDAQQHIIFTRTYLPPQHLLQIEKNSTDVLFHDLSIEPFPGAVYAALEELKQPKTVPNRKVIIYLVIPSCFGSQVESLIYNTGYNSATLLHQIFPHFHTEDLDAVITELMMSRSLVSSLSLSVWRIE